MLTEQTAREKAATVFYTSHDAREIIEGFAQALLAVQKQAVEAAAVAAEQVVPRHTECGNRIAAAIRTLKE